MDFGDDDELSMSDLGDDLEMEDESKMSNLLENAERARDEQLDDVKHMNQMTLYAKVVTVRDKQLEENKELEQEWV